MPQLIFTQLVLKVLCEVASSETMNLLACCAKTPTLSQIGDLVT